MTTVCLWGMLSFVEILVRSWKSGGGVNLWWHKLAEREDKENWRKRLKLFADIERRKRQNRFGTMNI